MAFVSDQPRRSLADITAVLSGTETLPTAVNPNTGNSVLDLPAINSLRSQPDSRRGSLDLSQMFQLDNNVAPHLKTQSLPAKLNLQQHLREQQLQVHQQLVNQRSGDAQAQVGGLTKSLFADDQWMNIYQNKSCNSISRLSSDSGLSMNSSMMDEKFITPTNQSDSGSPTSMDECTDTKPNINVELRAGYFAQINRNPKSKKLLLEKEDDSSSRKRSVVNAFAKYNLTDDMVQNMPYHTLVKWMNENSLESNVQEEIKLHRKRLQNRKHVKKYSKKQKHSNIHMQAVTDHLESEIHQLRTQLTNANLSIKSLAEELAYYKVENQRVKQVNEALRQHAQYKQDQRQSLTLF